MRRGFKIMAVLLAGVIIAVFLLSTVLAQESDWPKKGKYPAPTAPWDYPNNPLYKLKKFVQKINEAFQWEEIEKTVQRWSWPKAK